MKKRNPMHPPDTGREVPGWTYEVHYFWRQSRMRVDLWEQPREDSAVCGAARTLAAARELLQQQAALCAARLRVTMKASSANRYYGSRAGRFQVEVFVRAVEAAPAKEST